MNSLGAFHCACTQLCSSNRNNTKRARALTAAMQHVTSARVFCRNKYVRTEGFVKEQEAGRMLFKGARRSQKAARRPLHFVAGAAPV